MTVRVGVVVAVATVFGLVGCSTSTTVTNGSTGSKLAHTMNAINTQEATSQANQTIVVSKQPVDGRLASVQRITTYHIGSALKLYKIFYWSNGVKVEAFLSEPSKPGKYPLLVNLHGGWVLPHSHSPFGYTSKAVAVLSQPNTVMLYPEYKGYMGSPGAVHGVKSDLLDVKNAISAVKSMDEVAANQTYLIGFSLGGGLALMTADVDQEVKAVVAVSPFVGLKDVVSWDKKHLKSGSPQYQELLNLESEYGGNVNSSAYSERSPHVQRIDAPVLLLQGTADQSVEWQTVQMFANQMKAAHKTVKFVLYPGGHHGLHGQYQAESTSEIEKWFAKYGLNVTAMYSN